MRARYAFGRKTSAPSPSASPSLWLIRAKRMILPLQRKPELRPPFHKIPVRLRSWQSDGLFVAAGVSRVFPPAGGSVLKPPQVTGSFPGRPPTCCLRLQRGQRFPCQSDCSYSISQQDNVSSWRISKDGKTDHCSRNSSHHQLLVRQTAPSRSSRSEEWRFDGQQALPCL